MANFDYVRLPGLWVPTSVLTAEEMAKLDADHVDSINGGTNGGGGSWSPSSPIIIGGAGLSVTGPSSFVNVTQLTRTGRARRRARVPLAIGNHTIDTSQGDCFTVQGDNAGAPVSGADIITLRNGTSPAPQEGELIEIVVDRPLKAGGLGYIIFDQAGGTIAQFLGIASPVGLIAAQFEYTSGAWRPGLNSGYDASVQYGVRSP